MCNLVVPHVHEIPCTTWHEMKRKGTVSQTLSIFTVFSSIPSMSHSLSKYLNQVISVLLVSVLLLLNQHYPLHPFPLLFSRGQTCSSWGQDCCSFGFFPFPLSFNIYLLKGKETKKKFLKRKKTIHLCE